MLDINDPKNKLIKEFFSKKKFLIVDPATTGRQTFRKCLRNLGANNSSIFVAENFGIAMSELSSKKPEIVICQRNINKADYEELQKSHLQLFPNRLEVGFVIISSENSKAMSAIVLDSELDGFISSPYNTQIIEETLLEVFKEKIKPSKDIQMIEKCKELILLKRFDEATHLLEQAKFTDQYASLSFYYRGLIFKNLGSKKKALESFLKGLEINPKHYKCARALTSIYVEEKEYLKAYEYETMLCSSYPINPHRIPNLVKLSLIAKNYDDIKNYCELFRELKDQSNTVKKYISAGLALCGKFMMNSGDKIVAEQMLLSAAQTSEGRPVVIASIVNTFLENNKLDKAKLILKKYNFSDKMSERDLSIIEFSIFAMENSVSDIFREGRKMINKGIKHENVYVTLLKAAIKGNMKAEKIEDIFFEAKKECPKELVLFEQIMKTSKVES